MQACPHDDTRTPMITRGTLHPCMHNTSAQRDTDTAVRPMAWRPGLPDSEVASWGSTGNSGAPCSTHTSSQRDLGRPSPALIEAKGCCVRGATPADQAPRLPPRAGVCLLSLTATNSAGGPLPFSQPCCSAGVLHRQEKGANGRRPGGGGAGAGRHSEPARRPARQPASCGCACGRTLLRASATAPGAL